MLYKLLTFSDYDPVLTAVLAKCAVLGIFTVQKKKNHRYISVQIRKFYITIEAYFSIQCRVEIIRKFQEK